MLRPADIAPLRDARSVLHPHVMWVVGIVPDKMGGFERTCAEFARQCRRSGRRASFVFEGEPCDELADALAANAADYHVIADVGVLGLAHSLRLAKLVRKLKPNFVHLHFCEFYRPFHPMAAALGVPLAATYHYSGEPIPSQGLRRTLKAIRRMLFRGSLRNISAVSTAARSKFESDYLEDSDRIHLTYNGTDLLGFRERSPGFTVGSELPDAVDAASPKLLYVGALSEAKGVHVAIRALARVRTNLPRATLTIVGAGPDRETLHLLAAELGVADRVFFLGLRSDVPQILAAHDIMLVPSIWKEAFGYVIVEAMAVGCPVIASNVGGIPEVIANGREGILVRPADEASLAIEIEKLAKNPVLRAALVRCAEEKVRSTFALDASVARYWQLYS